MQLVNSFKRVAHPIIIVLVLAIALGYAPFAYAAPGEQKVSYYLYDHLGGVDKMTDEKGNVICSNDYLPFGDIRRGDCTENNEDYGFTGKEKDPETGLMYYGARYYDPAIGRFTSIDPLILDEAVSSNKKLEDILKNPQMLNAYAYTLNNPLIFIDLFGEDARAFFGAFGKMVDGAIRTIAGTPLFLNVADKKIQKAGGALILKGSQDVGRGLYQAQENSKWIPSTLEKAIDFAVQAAAGADLTKEQKAALGVAYKIQVFEPAMETIGGIVDKLILDKDTVNKAKNAASGIVQSIKSTYQAIKNSNQADQNRAKINSESDRKKPRIPKKEKND